MRFLALALLVSCLEVPAGTSTFPAGQDTAPPGGGTTWTCRNTPGGCFCTVGPPSGTTCSTELTCCVLRRSDLGDTCECTGDDEVACQERLGGDPTATQVPRCPP